jgi:hypothetical protein
MKASIIALAIALAASSPAAAAADEEPARTFAEFAATASLKDGARVRITFIDPGTGIERQQEARFRGVSPTTLRFEVDGQPGRLPSGAVLKIEHKVSRVARSAGIGALSGAATLGLLALAGRGSEGDLFYTPAGQAFGVGAIFGAPIGAALGALAGVIGGHDEVLLDVELADGAGPERQEASAPPTPYRARQEDGDDEGWSVPDERERRWHFQAWTGFLPGNPGSGLEEKLREAGFGDTTPGGCFFFCVDATPHPYTDKKRFPWGVELGYRFRPGMMLSAVASKTTIGTTVGYDGDTGGSIRFTRQLHAYSALASWTPTDRFRIGAGPALYTLTFDSGFTDEHVRQTRMGALVDATVDLVHGRTFILSAKAQYRYTGSIEAGPFTRSSHTYWQDRETTIAPIDVSYNHFFVGASVGFRF